MCVFVNFYLNKLSLFSALYCKRVFYSQVVGQIFVIVCCLDCFVVAFDV